MLINFIFSAHYLILYNYHNCLKILSELDLNIMDKKFLLTLNRKALILTRNFSIESIKRSKDHYKLLIVGGGSGGIETGAKFARKLGIAIVYLCCYLNININLSF